MRRINYIYTVHDRIDSDNNNYLYFEFICGEINLKYNVNLDGPYYRKRDIRIIAEREFGQVIAKELIKSFVKDGDYESVYVEHYSKSISFLNSVIFLNDRLSNFHNLLNIDEKVSTMIFDFDVSYFLHHKIKYDNAIKYYEYNIDDLFDMDEFVKKYPETLL